MMLPTQPSAHAVTDGAKRKFLLINVCAYETVQYNPREVHTTSVKTTETENAAQENWNMTLKHFCAYNF